jgi:hypothetical protein
MITVHILKIEQGRGSCRCDPRGVQILFKQAYHLTGEPHEAFLREL